MFLKYLLFYLVEPSDLRSTLPIISVLPKVTVSCLLFVIFKTALFQMNFNFIMFVVCSFTSKIFTMAIPDDSSMKGASIMTIFCDFGMISTVITGKNGIDLLRKLNMILLNQLHLLIWKCFSFPWLNLHCHEFWIPK